MSEYRRAQAEQARRRNAWELLQQTRNPTYVALRYGYPVETMEKALEKIPDNSGRPFVRSAAAKALHSGLTPARELLPENLVDPTCAGANQARPARRDDGAERSREPGEDDEEIAEADR